MAQACGLSPSTVGRIGLVFGLQPPRSKTFKLSQDPVVGRTLGKRHRRPVIGLGRLQGLAVPVPARRRTDAEPCAPREREVERDIYPRGTISRVRTHRGSTPAGRQSRKRDAGIGDLVISYRDSVRHSVHPTHATHASGCVATAFGRGGAGIREGTARLCGKRRMDPLNGLAATVASVGFRCCPHDQGLESGFAV